MKLFVKFKIPGNPLIQKRHRDRIVKKKDGTEFVTRYDPSAGDKNEWKAAVRRYAPPIPLMNCALRVDVCWVFPRPTAHYGSGRNAGTLKASAPKDHEHISKPDRDNLDKLILDAMTGMFWKDDSQVSQGFIKKMWGTTPATYVIIYLL